MKSCLITSVNKLTHFSYFLDKLIIESFADHCVNVNDDNLTQLLSKTLIMIVAPCMPLHHNKQQN